MIHKTELRSLLTRHRGLVAPETRGFPARARGRGRSVDGLSQEQMDMLLSAREAADYPVLKLLGVQGGWAAGMYGRLERGQLEHPYPAFLDDVALLLGLDEDTRRRLWGFAGGIAPVYPLRAEGGGVGPDQQAKLDTIGEVLGQIAWTTDYAFRRLQWNQLALEMFPEWAVVDGLPPENFLEWTIFEGPETFNMHFGAAWRPLALASLRGRLQVFPGDPELTRIEDRVLADSTLAPCYNDPALDAVVPDARPQPMRHGRLGPGWARLVFGQVPGADPYCDFMIINFKPDPAAEKPPCSNIWAPRT